MDLIQIAMTIISAIVSGVVAWIGRTIQKREDRRKAEEIARIERDKIKMKATEDGICALLRNNMVARIEECEIKRYASVEEVEDVTHMYEAYRSLGGNGVIKILFEKFLQLPHRSEVQ